MDYLAAIQFAAALNIGYIIPDIMAKMDGVLNNINDGYVNILQDVRNRIIVKSQEIDSVCVIETKDNRTTKGYIDQQLLNLKDLKEECDEKEESLGKAISEFVNCSGYRSVFFYSAMYSVLALLLIPFCHQHCAIWGFRMFFYSLNSISIVYLGILFLVIVKKKQDISCRSVFGLFILYVLVSIAAAYINSLLPVTIVMESRMESLMSFLSVVVSFLPGLCCMLFLMVLVFYAVVVARLYSVRARLSFWRVNKAIKKLNVINELFTENLTID